MTSTSDLNVPNVGQVKAPSPSRSPFLTVRDVVEPPKGAAGLSTAVQTSLSILKDVLEAVDTLPCVKYIAGVGVKILEITDVCITNVFKESTIIYDSIFHRNCKITKSR